MRSFRHIGAEIFGEVSDEEVLEADAFFEELVGVSGGAGFGEAVALDTRAAIPPFVSTEKARLQALLGATQRASAARWNGAKHPRRSGVDPSELRAALANYVDFGAVTQRLGAGVGADEILAEAVHQFQRKCFAETREHDGRAQASTLDSIGLVDRRGMRRLTHTNKHRKAYLRGKDSRIRRLSGGEFSGRRWYRYIIDPCFLGHRFFTVTGKFPIGVHLHFVRALRVAERHLLTLPAYAGKTPVEIGRLLGIDERHRGARPWAKSESIHTLGLAADINKAKAPWITHPKSTGTPAFIEIQARASWLVSGWTRPVDAAYLHSLGSGGGTTAAIYDEVKQRSDELVRYLGFASDPAALAAAVQARPTGGPPGSPTTEAAWLGRIQRDLGTLRNGANFGKTRNPLDGFIGHHRDLVIALRDAACMAWGAVDFGDRYSGDVMHFDVRRTPLGRVLNKIGYDPQVPCPTMPSAQPGPPVLPGSPDQPGPIREG